MIKVLSLTVLAGIMLMIDSRTLLKALKSRQSIIYILLLCTGWAIAWLYLSDINVKSPFQALESFFEPINKWLWG